jgi:hypothetical protein
MEIKFVIANPFTVVYANDLDAYVPEFWANESLAILRENINMVS